MRLLLSAMVVLMGYGLIVGPVWAGQWRVRHTTTGMACFVAPAMSRVGNALSSWPTKVAACADAKDRYIPYSHEPDKCGSFTAGTIRMCAKEKIRLPK